MTQPEIHQFRALMAEKAAAKALVMEAIGRARLAEGGGVDASRDWQVVEEQGMHGVEGVKMAAAQALADKLVAEHPDLFVNFEAYANPSGQEQLVKLIGLFKHSGMQDEATLLTMFELAKFERQKIGVATQAAMRFTGGKK